MLPNSTTLDQNHSAKTHSLPHRETVLTLKPINHFLSIGLAMALFVPTASAQAKFEFQQGLDSGYGIYAGTRDTQVSSSSPTTPLGSAVSAWSDASPKNQALFRFDDIIGSNPGQCPPGSYLAFATFTFTTISNQGGSAGAHFFYRMNQPFDDATITYANSFGGNGIGTSETAGLGLQIGGTSSGQTYSFDFRGVAQPWASGAANEGFMIATGHTDGLGLHTSESVTQSSRPKLTLWTLPQGAASFADTVVSYAQGTGSNSNNNPANALGEAVSGSVSLGHGGVLILEFTDNRLSGSGNSDPDLWIYESGVQNEGCFVDVSSDGINWFSVGSTKGGVENIDIDAFGFTTSDEFQFVRLTDDNLANNLPYAGADIYGVAAIETNVRLTALASSISIATGGSSQLLLDAAQPAANWYYWMFGSVTGTSPGIDFGNFIVLPLNYDAYFNLTLTKPGLGAFGNFLGQLNGAGEATASLNLPPGLDPALAGLVFHHAYLAGQNLGDVDYASNAVTVTLTP